MCQNYILLKDIYQQNAVLGEKKKSEVRKIHLFVEDFCLFRLLGIIYDSQATNRSAAREKGALTGSPPCFLLVAGESYMTPSRTATHFVTAIRVTG